MKYALKSCIVQDFFVQCKTGAPKWERRSCKKYAYVLMPRAAA